MSIQELLKLLVTDDEPLRLPQGFLSRVLPIDQQALEHLNTAGGRSASGYEHIPKQTLSHPHPLPSSGPGRAG